MFKPKVILWGTGPLEAGVWDTKEEAKHFLDKWNFNRAATKLEAELAATQKKIENLKKLKEDFETKKKKERTYCLGNLFQIGSEEYLLVSAGSGEVLLVTLSGTRIGNPVSVSDIYNVTPNELDKIVKQNLLPSWKYLGRAKDLWKG